MSEKGLPAKIVLKKCASRVLGPLTADLSAGGSIRVLTYHNITDDNVAGDAGQKGTPRGIFEEHMRYLKENGYRTVSADAVPGLLASAGAVQKNTVCLTFDDGYRDNYTNAFPVMDRYGLHGTVFLTAAFMEDGENAGGEYLRWDEIARMRKSGLFTFGCHSFSHRNMGRLEDGELLKETKVARDILEEGICGKINAFAYPFGWQGTFNASVIAAVKHAGYSCAYTGVQGANTRHTDPLMLKRARVSWVDGIDEFRRILDGMYDWYSVYQGIRSIWSRP